MALVMGEGTPHRKLHIFKTEGRESMLGRALWERSSQWQLWPEKESILVEDKALLGPF